MENTIEKISYKNHEIEIWYDDDASYNYSEHLGTFYTNIPRDLDPDGHLLSELKDEDGLITGKDIVFLCVNAYIHGGVALSTSDGWPFNDRWDGGLGGIMATTRERAREWFGRETPDDEIRKQLQSEVEELDHYCKGEVFGLTITDGNGECIGSVGGIVGDIDDYVNDAKRIIDANIDSIKRKSNGTNKLREKVSDLRDEIERLIDIKENQADEADAIGNHLISEELDDDAAILYDCVNKLDEVYDLLKNVLP